MNYHQPRQVDPAADRPDAGKWRYTNMNDGRIWPEGYCAENCPGHDTAEGAREHMTAYVLDHARYDGKWDNTQHRCQAEGCEAWTDRYAEPGHPANHPYDLCDEHRNSETLAQLVGSVGDVMGSW